jgi:hypothetical protein
MALLVKGIKTWGRWVGAGGAAAGAGGVGAGVGEFTFDITLSGFGVDVLFVAGADVTCWLFV